MLFEMKMSQVELWRIVENFFFEELKETLGRWKKFPRLI
jgi:hypothetical protein